MKAPEYLDYSAPTEGIENPLGPVSYEDAQALKPDFPAFTSVNKFQPVQWTIQAHTEEARELISALVASLGLQTAEDAKSKRGPKAKATDVQALEALLGSLLRHAVMGKWSMQKTTPSAFSGDHCPVGERTFRRIRTALEKAGLIETRKGWKFQERSEATKFHGSPSLFRMAQSYGVPWRDAGKHFSVVEDHASKAGPLVIIRPLHTLFGDDDLQDTDAMETSGGKPCLALPDTQEAKALVAQVEAPNAFVQGFRIESMDMGVPRTHRPVFQRIFHGDFDHHGRLYDQGGYQGTPKETRSTLTIDGEATVELDIHASGLTIAHAIAGMPLPRDRDDLYAFPGISRAAVKTWILASIGNGQLLKQWPHSADSEVRAHPRGEIREAVLEAYPFLRDIPGLAGVSRDNPKQAGFRIAALEAQAVLGAVFELMERGILALPIHDSIITQAKHTEEAEERLSRHYREVIGVVPRIRAKHSVAGHGGHAS